MTAQEIERLIQSGKTDEAMAACQQLITAENSNNAEVLRLRANIYALTGKYDAASDDQEMVLRASPDGLDDTFAAADYALKAGNYGLAEQRFSELLILTNRTSDPWYETAVYFYLAFIGLKRADKQHATKWIDSLLAASPKCKLPLPGRGMIEALTLKAEIDRLP